MQNSTDNAMQYELTAKVLSKYLNEPHWENAFSCHGIDTDTDTKSSTRAMFY